MEQIIREGNKVYKMNDKGIVVEASEEEVEIPVIVRPTIGSRVEAEGKRGTVHSRNASIYGDVYAIRFDDGTLGEYTANDISTGKFTEEEGVYASTLEEIKAQFSYYDQLPGYTPEEIDEKEQTAKQLKVAATNAIRQTGLDFQDRIALDNILLATSNDMSDLSNARHEFLLEKDERYKRVATARYSLSENVENYGGPLMGSSGNEDASWLETAMDGMTVMETTDADLAVTATKMVEALDSDLLADEDVLRDAISFQEDYLGIMNDTEMKEKFASYVDNARREKLAKPAVTKEASTENLDDFDASSLYM